MILPLSNRNSSLLEDKSWDWKLIISCVVITSMVFVRDMSMAHLGPMYFVGVIAAICLVLPYNNLVPFSFFYMGAGIGVNGIALIPLIVALYAKSEIINKKQILFPIIILLLEFLHWVTYDFSVEVNKFVLYALYNLIFFFLLFEETKDNDLIRKCILFDILGIAVALFIVMIHSTFSLGFDDIIYGTYRIGGDTGELVEKGADGEQYTAMNPNMLAYYSITAITLLLFVKDAIKSSLLKILVLIILGLSGVMSTSRTWLVVMALTLALYFLLSKLKGKIGFVIFSALLLYAAAHVSNYVDAFSSRYEHRFNQGSLSEIGGRGEIVTQYNNFLLANPEYIIYGTGAVYYNNVCKVGISSHTGSHQILICYGIIGVFIYIGAGIIFYRRFCKKKQKRLWDYIPFLICFIFDQTGQFLIPATMMMPFVACLLPLKMKDLSNE